MRLVAFAVFLLVGCSQALAFSCGTGIHFVVRCQNGTCNEGFFAPEVLTGNWCKTKLAVRKDQPAYNFSDEMDVLEKAFPTQLDGYYRINIRGYWSEERLDNLHCFKRNEAGGFSFVCNGAYTKIEKLSYSSDQSISSVIAEMANQSRTENILDWSIDLIVPIVSFLLIVTAVMRFRKSHGNLFATAAVVISSIGLVQSPFGRRAWLLTTLLGWLFGFVWVITRLVAKRQSRKLESRNEMSRRDFA